jgi:Ni,Fe-hydrogenase III large subunit
VQARLDGVGVLGASGARRARHCRTGSYANWPGLAHAARGNLLPEFPLINRSFELYYACAAAARTRGAGSPGDRHDVRGFDT